MSLAPKRSICLEYRSVEIQGQEIESTAIEFDISDIVWKEEYNEYSRKAINNHISNLRRKLKTTPDILHYAEDGAESVLDKLRRIMAGNLEETE